MDSDDISAVLGSVDIFRGLRPRVLKRLARAGRVVEAPPGAQIIRAGESVSGFHAHSPLHMHVILSGDASVRVNDQEVERLVVDDYFGDLALIDGQPRSADVVAGQSGLTTWSLGKAEFDKVVEEHPEVLLPMIRVVVARLRRAEAAAR
jgi:CRP/FNR family transcriptional regulator, cyclic AMP receptor protein